MSECVDWRSIQHPAGSSCTRRCLCVYLSAGVTYLVPMGLSMRPLNLWLSRSPRTRPFRTSLRPVQRLGSQWPRSHMARGQGSFTGAASLSSRGRRLADGQNIQVSSPEGDGSNKHNMKPILTTKANTLVGCTCNPNQR